MMQAVNQETVAQNIALFRELLTCEGQIYHWIYTREGNLLNTNSPHLVLNLIFEHSGSYDYMKSEFERMEEAKDRPVPIILGGPVGLMWCAAMESNNGAVYYHVIGPVKRAEVSKALIHQVAEASNIRDGWTGQFEKLIDELPSSSVPMFIRYALMLNYCVTGEKVSRSELQYQPPEAVSANAAKFTQLPKDRHATYMAEQALLHCVREGELNYKPALQRAGQLSNGIRITTNNPFNQAVISTASFTTLCVRAAIEGGLSPDLAYTIGDQYIQSMTESKTVSELTAINHAMFDDFVQRVHRAKANPSYSKLIQSCCEYITLHVEQELKLLDLAKTFGYSEYYLSRKFKQEVGASIQEYIHAAKTEHAKVLLACSDLPVTKIAEQLHYCSSTHFSTVFRKNTGMLPQQYRDRKQKM